MQPFKPSSAKFRDAASALDEAAKIQKIQIFQTRS